MDRIDSSLRALHRDRTPQANLPPPNSSASGVPRGKPDCPKCKGVGFLRRDLNPGDEGFGAISVCTCRDASLPALFRSRCGLDERSLALRLDQLTTEGLPGTIAMLAAVRAFIAHPTGFLTLHGPPGTGKTHALRAAVNALVDAGIEAVYIKAYDLRADLLTAPGITETAAVFDRYRSVPVLALDELDKLHTTEWTEAQITELIDSRYDRRLGTLIAMNDDPAHLPPHIHSRLAEGVVVRNADADMRRLV